MKNYRWKKYYFCTYNNFGTDENIISTNEKLLARKILFCITLIIINKKIMICMHS
jgi:hypothetical protein